jgi:isocitrate dehydrogenase
LITSTPRPVTSDTSQDPSSAGIVQIKEVSTSTAESEIEAVNHTLKAEVIATRNMLTMMGWKQATTVIEEDNSACVASSQVTVV